MTRVATLCRLLLLFITLLYSCKTSVPFHIIPAQYVYTIVEHNDSLYYSTPSGEIFRFSPDTPDSITRLGKKHFHPIRGLAFKNNGDFYAASYRTGVHRVLPDTLVAMPKMGRLAWSMKLDGFDNIWLAAIQGVFRQVNDTLMKFTDLREAYDVDFYHGKLAAGHGKGITLYDTATGCADTTYCKGTICWTIDVFDSLLVVGGVEVCALINNRHAEIIPIGPQHNIPWAAVRDSKGNIYLGTQKGLFRIKPNARQAECIGFKGKCIKSLLIDRKGRLWVGRYFK